MMIDDNGARVLAVDDEPAGTALLQRLITDKGYLIRIASERSRIETATPDTRRVR
jgi:CheY-like chemotaxis protein